MQERSRELDAEAWIGAGPGRPELAPGVGELEPVGVDLDAGRADDDELAVHHVEDDAERARRDHRLGEVERDVAQPGPEVDAPGHHPASGPNVPAALLLDLEYVFGRRSARPADRQIGGQRGQLDRKSTRLNSSHLRRSRMPSSA